MLSVEGLLMENCTSKPDVLILQDTNTEIVYSYKVCMEPSYCHFMENTSCNMTGTNTCWQWSSWGMGNGRHRGMSVTYALPYSVLDSTDCHHITWITPALSLSPRQTAKSCAKSITRCSINRNVHLQGSIYWAK